MSKIYEGPLPNTWRERLQVHVKYYMDSTGMKPTTFGRKSINNQRFWKNFSAGGTITLEKADEIYAFMAETGFNFQR